MWFGWWDFHNITYNAVGDWSVRTYVNLSHRCTLQAQWKQPRMTTGLLPSSHMCRLNNFLYVTNTKPFPSNSILATQFSQTMRFTRAMAIQPKLDIHLNEASFKNNYLSACFFTLPRMTTSSPTFRLFGMAWEKGKSCNRQTVQLEFISVQKPHTIFWYLFGECRQLHICLPNEAQNMHREFRQSTLDSLSSVVTLLELRKKTLL